MFRKLIYLFSLVLVLGLTSTAMAADFWWGGVRVSGLTEATGTRGDRCPVMLMFLE